MSVKSLTNKVTSKVGRQVLIVKKGSPTLLIAAGVIGVGTSVVLACRATLKLSETLAEAEEHLKKVEVTVTEGEEETKKAGFNIRLQTAIKVAKLYAPAAIIGVASVGAIAGSHVILKKRNAGLTAAYAIVHKSFDEYRARVVADQGKEKDLEYRFGLAEREIVEEGPNGPEVKIVKGLDQNAVKEAEKRSYARIFDPSNPNWSDAPNDNKFFLQMVHKHANDMLWGNGYVFLSDVYDMLGFPRTMASQRVGWVKHPEIDPETGAQRNDTYIDFGVWSNGIYKGKEWINGNPGAYLLDFNVDGDVMHMLEDM